MENLTGKQLGPYRVIGPLGEGGMASVYKAYQPGVDRLVALKILPRHFTQNQEFINRFNREAKVVAHLQHPHILPVFDYGEADGYTYLVMPFMESGTLDKLLKNAPLPYDQIERILYQVGDALDCAHSQSIIHRDVKPNNILIDKRGNCLLTDFGIARTVEGTEKLTSTGAVMGTPAYMSPEQGKGEIIDGRSDLYALGIILYEMTTGRVPFIAQTPVAVIIKHIHDPLPMPRSLNPTLSEAMERVILKALAKNPNDRYQTGAELVQAFQNVIPANGNIARPAPAPTILSPQATPSQISEPTILQAKKRRTASLIAYGVIALVILGLVGLGWAYQAGTLNFTGAPPATATIPPTNFPLPDDATSVTKAINSDRIMFYTKLSTKDLLTFFRAKFAEKEWVERIQNTYMDERGLHLLFDNAETGQTIEVEVTDRSVDSDEEIRYVAIDYLP